MTATMRAKLVVNSVSQHPDGNGGVHSETLAFNAVCKDGAYPEDGSDENNSFARWTPSASLTMQIVNPALVGKFKVGDKFYVDFTPAQA